MKADKMTENEKTTIKRIQEGHTEEYGLLVSAYADEVFRFIVKLVPCVADAEELRQDTFMKAFKGIKDYRGDASFGTWLLGIAYRTVLSYERKHPPRIVYLEENDHVLAEIDEEVVNRELNTTSEEQIARLMKTIYLLSTEDRTLVTEHYLEERPLKEVAQLLGIEYGAALTRLHRVRKKIYLMIKKME